MDESSSNTHKEKDKHIHTMITFSSPSLHYHHHLLDGPGKSKPWSWRRFRLWKKTFTVLCKTNSLKGALEIRRDEMRNTYWTHSRVSHIHTQRQTQTLYTSSSHLPSCHHHLNLVPAEATHIREDQASLLTDDDPAVKEDITTGAKTVSILWRR